MAASLYQKRISEIVGDDVNAGQVEAWMRLEYGVLDGLSAAKFAAEARAGAMMVEAAPAESAGLAASYGLGGI